MLLKGNAACRIFVWLNKNVKGLDVQSKHFNNLGKSFDEERVLDTFVRIWHSFLTVSESPCSGIEQLRTRWRKAGSNVQREMRGSGGNMAGNAAKTKHSGLSANESKIVEEVSDCLSAAEVPLECVRGGVCPKVDAFWHVIRARV